MKCRRQFQPIALCLPLLVSPEVLAFSTHNGRPYLLKHTTRPITSTALRSSSSDDDGNSNNLPDNNKLNLSTSARERRNEELRRLSRTDDVVIGKTSAKANAKDYALDPDQTEREWYGQASDLEREVNEQTERGLRALKLLSLDEADEAFNRVYALKPDAYLWQAGVVKYYRDELLEAAKCFASNAMTYELKFAAMGIPASEERIWRDACQLRALSSSRIRIKGVRKGEGADGLYAQIYDDIVAMTAPQVDPLDEEDEDHNGETSSRETRKVIRIVRDLFKGSIDNDLSAVALNRAKLRSITGEYGSAPTADRKKWKLSSWYYLGLHYDAVGEIDEAKACMKMALRQGQSSGNGDDIINILPFLHMSIRDWFDDDEFSLDDDFDDEDDGGDWSSLTSTGMATIWDNAEPQTYTWSANKDAKEKKEAKAEDSAEPERNAEGTAEKKARTKDDGARSVVKIAIQASLEKVRLTDLQESLKKRGMKTTGSKAELQKRLLDELLEDAGFGDN